MANWRAFDACVRAARRIVHDEDTARDIAVDVCEAGYGVLMARWRALDHLRRGQLDIVRGFDIDRVSGGPTPEEILIAKQERESLVEFLGVVAVRILENADGLTDEELGSQLQKSPEAIRQIRSRARRKLIEVD